MLIVTNTITMRFSFLTPYLLFPSNTIRFNKYFWCSRFCESYCKPIKWVSIQDIALFSRTLTLVYCSLVLYQIYLHLFCVYFLACSNVSGKSFFRILRQQTGLLRESTNVGAVWPSHRSSSRNQQSNRISQQVVVMVSLLSLLLFIDFLLTGLKHSSSCCFFHSSLLRQRKPAMFFAGNIRQYFPA